MKKCTNLPRREFSSTKSPIDFLCLNDYALIMIKFQ